MTGFKSKRTAALDKLAQEPVGWIDNKGNMICTKINESYKPLYTTPPQRPWVGLTDEEVDQFHNWKDCTWSTNELVRYVEAKLKEKNTCPKTKR